MLTFRDSARAERAKRLRDHGMDPAKRYWHPEVGFNYRLTNLQAAIGVAQLEQIEHFIQRKIGIGSRYRSLLTTLSGIQLPVERYGVRNVYWLYSIVIDTVHLCLGRDELIKRLLANGIETRPLFYPLHAMPPYIQYGRGRQFPNSSWLSANGLSLPSAVHLSNEEIEHVFKIIEGILKCRATLKCAEVA